MGASNTYPIIPLPYDTVLFPNRKLQLSSTNRQDVIAIIANYYNGSLGPRGQDEAALVACVPFKSPYLNGEGQKLIESPEKEKEKEAKGHVVPDAAQAKKEELFHYGCLAKITSVEGGRSGEIKVVLEGMHRIKLEKFVKEKPFFEARVKSFKDEGKDTRWDTEEGVADMVLPNAVDVWDPAVKGAFSQLKELATELFQLIRMTSLVSQRPTLPPMLARQLEVFVARKDISEAGVLADFIAILGQTSHEDKLRLLSAVSIAKRLQIANELVTKQISNLQGGTRIITIASTNQNNITPDQLKQLQNMRRSGMPFDFNRAPPGMMGSPGGSNAQQPDEEENEIVELKKRLEEAQLTPEAQKVATREIKRLEKMNPAQAEYQVIRNYLENLAEIPWTKVTEDQLNAATLARARKQLDDDHYGLEKIKKRLLEYLAVLRLKQEANSTLERQIKTIQERVQETNDASDSESETNVPNQVENEELVSLQKKRQIDKSPILLLVGPPGTGKTSLAKSVATALGRKFHRISLGGVRDEAEIRGHRRTYVAAMPGLIVNGLKKVGVSNPVILLDEIDKVGGSNFHGDPSAAMLEVLDPEQNWSFTDHYVNIPIDLSKVLFIATANTLETIPPPLLDRMETIQLSGYTTLEKRHIASRHLIPKQVTTNGLNPGDVTIPPDVIDKIITAYTRESGVRNLEREIGSVCRYKAVQFSDSQNPTDSSATSSSTSSVYNSSASTNPQKAPTSATTYSPLVKPDDLEDILGIERFEDLEVSPSSNPRPGVVTGLVAFSSLGQGSILFIEILDMPGTGRVQLTGKLGDVLKESVEVALTWVKAHAFALGLTHDEREDIMKERAIHVHCPAGAVPKDGPSAGLAHTVALISLFSGRSVPSTLAMTGEVSLRGKVTPVGGIKEKLIGALRAGVKTVMLPKGNRKDVGDLPAEVKEGLRIVFVEHIWEALRCVWPDEKVFVTGQRWEVESRL